MLIQYIRNPPGPYGSRSIFRRNTQSPIYTKHATGLYSTTPKMGSYTPPMTHNAPPAPGIISYTIYKNKTKNQERPENRGILDVYLTDCISFF